MSDKMLMEDWRKFLVEAPEDVEEAEPSISGFDQKYDHSHEDHHRGGEDSNEVKKDLEELVEDSVYCWDLGPLIKIIKTSQAEIEDPETLQRAKNVFTNWWEKEAIEQALTLVAATGLVAANLLTAGGAALFTVVAMGAIKSARLYAEEKAKDDPNYRYNAGIETDFPLAKLFAIHPRMRDTLNSNIIRSADEEYEEYLVNKLKQGMISGEEAGGTELCLDPQTWISTGAIMDISTFIMVKRFGMSVDLAREAIAGMRADIDITSDKPYDPAEEEELALHKQRYEESKNFHDDWRNFLLTEEKK